MEGEAGSEYLREFPFIDHVVVGDGDDAFPALLRRIASRQPPVGIPGVLSNTVGGTQVPVPAPLCSDLDALPTPNYDEFFERARQLQVLDRPDCGYMLPFEASRGCWWGEKHHCTFCGFNKSGMTFSSKSAGRPFDELAELAGGTAPLCCLARTTSWRCATSRGSSRGRGRRSPTTCSTARSNRTSRASSFAPATCGGSGRVQPGIESLSTHILLADEKRLHDAPQPALPEVVPLLRHVRRLEPALGLPRRAAGGLRTPVGGDEAHQSPRPARQLWPSSRWNGIPRSHNRAAFPISRSATGPRLPLRLPAVRVARKGGVLLPGGGR